MEKYSFMGDYSEGCHPDILQLLQTGNLHQQQPYGADAYSDRARRLIAARLCHPASQIHFVAGGTQANLIIAAASLRSHEALVAAQSGHIASREAGALEATGHKVIAMASESGKLSPATVQRALEEHAAVPHMVKPRMVYISNATEFGTVYSKDELQDLSAFCRDRALYLFMDGARLGTALCAKVNDVSLQDLAEFTDVFTIGATKNGGLLGEAIVINHGAMAEDFATHVKQRGALMAKGRILGIQFQALFQDDLFFRLARHANHMAQKLAQALVARGYELQFAAQTNLVFPILPNEVLAELQHHFALYPWGEHDSDHTVTRLVTSWATPEDAVERFIAAL